MNAKYTRWPLVCLLVIAGCIPSLNPVYRKENLVFDPSVIGLWKQPKSTETWQFTKRDNTSYDVVYTDEQGQQGDLLPALPTFKESGFWTFFLTKPSWTLVGSTSSTWCQFTRFT